MMREKVDVRTVSPEEWHAAYLQGNSIPLKEVNDEKELQELTTEQLLMLLLNQQQKDQPCS